MNWLAAVCWKGMKIGGIIDVWVGYNLICGSYICHDKCPPSFSSLWAVLGLHQWILICYFLLLLLFFLGVSEEFIVEHGTLTTTLVNFHDCIFFPNLLRWIVLPRAWWFFLPFFFWVSLQIHYIFMRSLISLPKFLS